MRLIDLIDQRAHNVARHYEQQPSDVCREQVPAEIGVEELAALASVCLGSEHEHSRCQRRFETDIAEHVDEGNGIE